MHETRREGQVGEQTSEMSEEREFNYLTLPLVPVGCILSLAAS